MLNTIKKRIVNDGRDDKGFNLIELIIVIVIIGILVAIAIPVYGNLQDNARDSAVSAAASNGLSTAAAQVAQGTSVDVSGLSGDDITVASTGGASEDIESLCITATHTQGNEATAGNGCGSTPTPPEGDL